MSRSERHTNSLMWKCLLVAMLLTVDGLATPDQARKDPSCETTSFPVLELDLKEERRVASPDGQRSVFLRVRGDNPSGGSLRVETRGSVIGRFALRDLSGNIVIGWAPDSNAFYFMWSNGGAVGGYELRVFRVSASSAAEVPAARESLRDFARRYPCPTRGHNTFPIQWRNGSRDLLVAHQVYPTSDCGRHLGLYAGYIVRVTDGAIRQRYSEEELKRAAPKECLQTSGVID